jgi:hypothetical protein
MPNDALPWCHRSFKEANTVNLTLSDEEVTLLARLLTSDLGDLRAERGKTDNREWRVAMKQDEEIISDIIRRLGESDRLSARIA